MNMIVCGGYLVMSRAAKRSGLRISARLQASAKIRCEDLCNPGKSFTDTGFFYNLIQTLHEYN